MEGLGRVPSDQECLVADNTLTAAIRAACILYDRPDLLAPLLGDLEGIIQFVAHVEFGGECTTN
jgi:hypothetical protein